MEIKVFIYTLSTNELKPMYQITHSHLKLDFGVTEADPPIIYVQTVHNLIYFYSFDGQLLTMFDLAYFSANLTDQRNFDITKVYVKIRPVHLTTFCL